MMDDGSARPRQKWKLTSAALAKFLAYLDEDAEGAGEKYETLRLTLVKFFDWRCAPFPEELADEALNRVIRKVDEGDPLRDVPTYCLGVARLLLLEAYKRPERRHVGLDEVGPLALAAQTEREGQEQDARQACFEGCLQTLSPENRELILAYYQDERRQKINNRLALSQRLGLPLNALRSRVQRMRDRLEHCVVQCLQKNNARPT